MGLLNSKWSKLFVMSTVALSLFSQGFVGNISAEAGKVVGNIVVKKELVIVDADMGELSDDASAMLMLINSPKVNVLGVTINAGSIWSEEGTAYALKQLEKISRTDIPVVQGAVEPLMGSRQSVLGAEQELYGNYGFLGSYNRPRPSSYLSLGENQVPYGGYPTTKPLDMTASDFIVKQVKQNPNEVTIFVLGPATNLALAVKTHPEIVPLVKQVIYSGGAIDVPGNTTPTAEYNWWYDPHAIKIALKTPFKKQIVLPLDVTTQFKIDKKTFDKLVSKPETPVTKMYKDLWGPRFVKDANYKNNVFDAFAAAVFLNPEIVTKKADRYIDIDITNGPSYGKALGYGERVNRNLNNPEDFAAGTQRIEVIFQVDEKAFWDVYIDNITRNNYPNWKPGNEQNGSGAQLGF